VCLRDLDTSRRARLRTNQTPKNTYVDRIKRWWAQDQCPPYERLCHLLLCTRDLDRRNLCQPTLQRKITFFDVSVDVNIFLSRWKRDLRRWNIFWILRTSECPSVAQDRLQLRAVPLGDGPCQVKKSCYRTGMVGSIDNVTEGCYQMLDNTSIKAYNLDYISPKMFFQIKHHSQFTTGPAGGQVFGSAHLKDGKGRIFG
jgi:hypothetical protein